MVADCQRWRKTVEGVGIDELYKRTDPFDVSPHIKLEGKVTFDLTPALVSRA
jgi:hypothetical protein